jgi:hypothetical protein
MILSQPVSRGRVWLEKWSVLASFLLVMAVLQYTALEAGPFAGRAVGRELMFLTVMLCSTAFWTLVAGSTIGGVAFSLAALLLLEMGANIAAARLSGVAVDLFAPHPLVAGLRVAYAVLTWWLGWRLLARFEVTGEGAGAATLAITGAAPDLLRCRPKGALRNLVRKELRLQQPTFLIAALFTGCWLAALAFFALPPDRPRAAGAVFTTMLAIYVPLAVLVAATVSVSEDTTLGVRAWHLTLPVSSRTQWLVKLVITGVMAAAAAIGLPFALAALAPAVVPLTGRELHLPPALVLLLVPGIVLGFWASTLIGQTVRAAVATGVAVATLGFCAAAGGSAGLRWGPGSDVLTWIMVRYQLTPEVLYPGPAAMRRAAIAVCSIVALTALHQSLAAFRRVNVDRRTIMVYSLRLAAASFAAAFIVMAVTRASAEQWRSAPVRELEHAIKAVALTNHSATAITTAELKATALLSPGTQDWLRGSAITITRVAPRASAAPFHRRLLYQVRVVFPNGRVYRTAYFENPPVP